VPGKLWESTRDWHHKCEEHPVGAAMASGNPPRAWYASWLGALYFIHYRIDPYMPVEAHRAALVLEDINELKIQPIVPTSVMRFLEADLDEDRINGYCYVLTGAHLMGGEIMRRRLELYPTKHLEWDDRPAALAYLKTLRDREEYTEGALDCFKLLYDCMEKIQKNII
jgi:hypothetical protein